MKSERLREMKQELATAKRTLADAGLLAEGKNALSALDPQFLAKQKELKEAIENMEEILNLQGREVAHDEARNQ